MAVGELEVYGTVFRYAVCLSDRSLRCGPSLRTSGRDDIEKGCCQTLRIDLLGVNIWSRFAGCFDLFAAQHPKHVPSTNSGQALSSAERARFGKTLVLCVGRHLARSAALRTSLALGG